MSIGAKELTKETDRYVEVKKDEGINVHRSDAVDKRDRQIGRGFKKNKD